MHTRLEQKWCKCIKGSTTGDRKGDINAKLKYEPTN